MAYGPASSETVPLVAVADTGAMLKEVAQGMRRPHLTALQVGLRSGTLRLFVAQHVLLEMERNLPGFVREGGGTGDALAHWRDHYLPWTFVIDVPPDWASEHPGVRAVAARHPADAPTARLAVVLGCPVLTEDRDLIDNGFGDADWLTLALFASNEAFAALAERMAYVPSALLIEGVAALVRSLLDAPRWAQAAVLAALAGMLYRASHTARARERLRAAVDATEAAVDWLGPRLLQIQDWRQAGERAWAERTVASVRDVSLDEEVALLLASASAPQLAGDVARVLACGEALAATTPAIRSVLARNPAFQQVSRGRWQLGKPGAPMPDDAFGDTYSEWWLRTLTRAGTPVGLPLN